MQTFEINLIKTLFITVFISNIFAISSAKAEQQLNLYSARQEVLMKPLINDFERKTGIQVNIVAAKANQLINRILKEGEYTKADILLTSDVARLTSAKKKKLFTIVESEKLDRLVPEKYKDKEKKWFGLSLRARLLIYNKNKLGLEDFQGYIDLSNKKWKNKILVRSSNNVYNQSLIAAMIINYGENKVKNFLNNFVNNFARNPSGGDRDQIRAVLSGEGDVALVNSYYFLKMKDKDKENKYKNLLAYFPKDKYMFTHINISGAGIIKYTKNFENALKFLEFMVSDEAQSVYAKVNYEFPIRKNVIVNDFMNKYSGFQQDELNIELIGDLNKKAIFLMDKAGWK